MTEQHIRLRELVDRLVRIAAADGWGDDLNPTQRAALSYLCRANRFSRAPSHVADYLAATRGTVSQTLKALARKGLVTELRSETDGRSISYETTPEGRKLARRQSAVDEAIGNLPAAEADRLANGLGDLVRAALVLRGGRSFGICRSCRHHVPAGAQGTGGRQGEDAWCALLEVSLKPVETEQLCHEHEAVGGS